MSDNTTSTAPVKPQPPAVNLRPLTRHDVTLTPVWETIGRGTGKGVFYPTVKATKENLGDFIKFIGEQDIIDMLNAKQSQNAQTVLDHVISKNDKWKESYKEEEVEIKNEDGTTRKVKQTAFTKEGDKEVPVVDKAWYELSDLEALMPEILDLLEKGTIRGGVTIKSLKEENLSLTARLLELVAAARLNPGDMSKLIEASEIGVKIADNESEINRISAQRKSKLAEGSTE